MTRNRIPRFLTSKTDSERNSEEFSLPRNGLERNSDGFSLPINGSEWNFEGVSPEKWFGTNSEGVSLPKMVRNGMKRVFLFREMVRNGIPRFLSSAKQAEFRRKCRLFRLVPNSAEFCFSRKMATPTLVSVQIFLHILKFTKTLVICRCTSFKVWQILSLNNYNYVFESKISRWTSGSKNIFCFRKAVNKKPRSGQGPVQTLGVYKRVKEVCTSSGQLLHSMAEERIVENVLTHLFSCCAVTGLIFLHIAKVYNSLLLWPVNSKFGDIYWISEYFSVTRVAIEYGLYFVDHYVGSWMYS